MKKIFSGFLLALASISAAHAEWIPYSDNIQIDSEQVRSGDSITFFVRFDQPDVASNGKKYHHRVTQQTVNCKKKTMTLQAALFYDNKSNVVHSFRVPEYQQEERGVFPQTIGSGLLRAVCLN